ncbi:MAG: hypothetical protein ABSD38_38065 [Syntrophorhabdales bacterium]|jgi:hypothetical protein
MRLRSMGRAVCRGFVVRIYCSSPDKPELLLGEAEEVREKRVRSFRNLEDLRVIVNPRKGKGAKKAAARGPADPHSSNPK